MFFGTIPSEMRSIVRETARAWDCDSFYVGCSGNFTVERTLTDIGKPIHSCDVTLYSGVLGWYYSDSPINVTLNEEYVDKLGFLEDYMNTPEEKVATVLISSNFANIVKKNVTPYYERLYEGYVNQWDSLHKATMEKMANNRIHLSSYSHEDVSTWIDRIPDNAGVIMYPPFFAGDYTKMFDTLEKMWVFEKAPFEELTPELKDLLFEKIVEKNCFLFGTNEKRPDLDEYWTCLSKTTNRMIPIYVYSNKSPTRIMMPRQRLENLPVRHLGPNERLEGEVKMFYITLPQFSMLRSEFMDKEKIIPGRPSAQFGVSVGGKLIGVFALSTSPTLGNWGATLPQPTVYLLSDFPVSNTSYPRLSKLVLYVALSKEVKHFVERLTKKRCRSMVTSAFTLKNRSMKYSGLFYEANRKDLSKAENNKLIVQGTNDHGNANFQINYAAKLGEWTVKEGYELWKEKHNNFVER